MKSIHTPAYRALLDWLRESRKARHLSMRDVGQRMGMPHSWIGKAETGERRLDVTEYVRLCQALGVRSSHGIAIVEDALSRSVYPHAAEDPLPKAADPRPLYSRSRRPRS
jgi:transcriptional regulator with XRE-family HTH domain